MKKITATTADISEFTNMARKVNFFSQMTVGLLDKILTFVMLYEYKKGEKVCKQGGPGDSFYVVYSGRLGVHVKKGFFGSKLVATLGPGDFFGEMALLDGKPRNATVECEEDSRVFILLAEHFEEVVKGNPEFESYMKSLAAGRKFELNQNI